MHLIEINDEVHMKIEVLVSTMNQDALDLSIFEKMNIKGNGIVCNQTNTDSVFIQEKGVSQKIFSHQERGVGYSRNTLLLRSKADICVLADDDMVFKTEYEEIVDAAFKENPESDIIIFNLENSKGSRFKKNTRINNMNYTKYGAARIAFRRKSVLNNQVFFSFLFGGGAIYGSGEDTLFLKHCLNAGLNIIGINKSIAKLLDDRASTWFEGYNEKYYFDKGALFYMLSKNIFYLNALQYSFRKHKLSDANLGFFKTIQLMIQGSKAVKKFQSYQEFND